MTLPDSTDVMVIGGGPAGLAAAIAARQRGLSVTLADCAVPPIDKACGEGVMPDGIAAAHALGVRLETACGRPFRGIRFLDGNTTVEALFPSGRGIGTRRTALHQLMVERAAEAGVTLGWGVPVTGITGDGVCAGGRTVRAKWIVGADGVHSRVRQWAGLGSPQRSDQRYGFRRHYRIDPWTELVEVHWAHACQLYLTPMAPGEVCVALLSREQHLRLDDALPRFPEVAHRLGACAGPIGSDRGAVSGSLRLASVWRGRVALIGDASGCIDPITGEGMCLAFRQALALGEALQAGDLRIYAAAHRKLSRRPEMMAKLMLMLDRSDPLRRRAIRAFASNPRLFARMLAMHVGESSASDFLATGLAVGWRMLTV